MVKKIKKQLGMGLSTHHQKKLACEICISQSTTLANIFLLDKQTKIDKFFYEDSLSQRFKTLRKKFKHDWKKEI